MDKSILRCHQSGPVSLPVHVFLRQSRPWSHEDPGEAAGPGQKSWLIVELNTSKHIKRYRKYFLSLLTNAVQCILQLKAGYFLHSNSRSSKTRSRTLYDCGSLQNEVPSIEQLNLHPCPAWLKVSGKLTSRTHGSSIAIAEEHSILKNPQMNSVRSPRKQMPWRLKML